MSLTEKQRKHLRALAHHRKVIVIVGQSGLTENVIGEIDNALGHHELVKVRINAGDRDARQAMIDNIRAQTESEVVQTIGHIGVFYRAADKPVISLPHA
jgi:RNA-binding protein